MASEPQVKQYLASWFLLGKKIISSKSKSKLLPEPVFENGTYSRDFEQIWQFIQASEISEFYLEGTEQIIGELLTPEWELVLCSRCTLPIPLRTHGMPPGSCPCHDLPSWPNLEVPLPRIPANTNQRLESIRDRINQSNLDFEQEQPNQDSSSQQVTDLKLTEILNEEVFSEIPSCSCRSDSKHKQPE